MKKTPQALELAEDILIAADISYWARTAWKNDALIVREEESHNDEPEHTGRISPADLIEWLHGPGPKALLDQVGDRYQRQALASLVIGDLDTDYDAATGDLIVQQMILGEVIYG